MYIKLIVLLVVTNIFVNGSVIMLRFLESGGRIVGGEDAVIESYPYQVSVRIFNFHKCGGSIITERIVITAAHCIYPYLEASYYSVQYGTSVIGGIKNIIPATRILQNENYNSSNFDNDVALIFLVSDIPFSAVSRPIRLASEAPRTGVFAVITGWGALTEQSPNASILQHVSVQIMDRSTCQKQYNDINKVTETMLCAGVNGGGKDACKDDSGGPLVRDGELLGIISYGLGCGRPNYFGVYTNVAVLRNWIVSNIYNHK